MIDRYEVQSIKEIFSDRFRFKIYTQLEYLRIEFLSYVNESLKIEFDKTYIDVTERDLQEIRTIENKTKHEIGAFLTWFSHHHIDHRYLHADLTSSDLLDSALNLQIQQARVVVQEKFDNLYSSLHAIMNKYSHLPYMARTHGQLAKETTFAHFINTKIEHLERAYDLFEQASEALNFVKFAGPVGDQTIELKMFEQYVNEFYNTKNKDLEFTQIIPRDLYANLIYGIVSLGIAVEKIALDIRLMSQSGIEELSERFYTNQIGSSAMPHKKNPIICENVTGLTRLLKSYLNPAIENINLWGYRDMTHSSVERVIVPDSFHLLCTILNKMTDVVDNLNVNEQNIIDNVTDVNMSTIILNKLTEILGRTSAYQETQSIMFEAIKENKPPEELLYERFQIRIEP